MAPMTVDEYVRAEQFKIEQLTRLGLSRDDAVGAVQAGCDWHEVERFLSEHPGCPVELAARITAPIGQTRVP